MSQPTPHPPTASSAPGSTPSSTPSLDALIRAAELLREADQLMRSCTSELEHIIQDPRRGNGRHERAWLDLSTVSRFLEAQEALARARALLGEQVEPAAELIALPTQAASSIQRDNVLRVQHVHRQARQLFFKVWRAHPELRERVEPLMIDEATALIDSAQELAKPGPMPPEEEDIGPVAQVRTVWELGALLIVFGLIYWLVGYL